MTEHFSNIKDILKGVQFRSTNPTYGQLISDWNELIGKKFANKCEIVEIKPVGTRLFLHVNVSSSPLVQEMMFFKANLIKKIKDKYNLDISDMVVKVANNTNNSAKNFKHSLVREVYDERPSKAELDAILLDEKEVDEIKTAIYNNSAFNDMQKERMLAIVIDDLKTQKWMKDKGFPVCEKCGCVITAKNFGEKNICKFCIE